jgi:hypothetical protein
VTALASYGIRAVLPPGFEGRIYRHAGDDGTAACAVAQFATFAIPAGSGDFGGGAMPHMTARDVFAVLLEYGPESAGTRLFADGTMPRTFEARDFQPYGARSGHAYHAGVQRFFIEHGRPFTFYAVLGTRLARRFLVARLNQLLAGITIEPAAA